MRRLTAVSRKWWLIISAVALCLLAAGFVLWQLTPSSAVDERFHPHMPYTADTFPRYPGSKQIDLVFDNGRFPSFALTLCTDDPHEKVDAYYKDLLTEAGWQNLDVLDTPHGLRPHYLYEAQVTSGRHPVYSYILFVHTFRDCSSHGMHTEIDIGLSFDLPLYPNSHDVQRWFTIGVDTVTYHLNFETADSKSAVLDFYMGLLGEGWRLETPTVSDPIGPTPAADWIRNGTGPENELGNGCYYLDVYISSATGGNKVKIVGSTP